MQRMAGRNGLSYPKVRERVLGMFGKKGLHDRDADLPQEKALYKTFMGERSTT